MERSVEELVDQQRSTVKTTPGRFGLCVVKEESR